MFALIHWVESELDFFFFVVKSDHVQNKTDYKGLDHLSSYLGIQFTIVRVFTGMVKITYHVILKRLINAWFASSNIHLSMNVSTQLSYIAEL